MIILLLIILYTSINSSIVRERKAQQSLNLVNSATNILLMLANSRDCIAYKSPVVEGLYANIVDVNKLKEFSEKYTRLEPECARSYDFGWRVSVNEIDKNDPKIIKKSWSFGAFQFEDPNKDNSKGFRDSIDTSMPIAIRYSEKDVRLGDLRIFLVDGEMEKIAGTFDWVCQMMKMNRLSSFSVTIHTNYGITYNESSNLFCSSTNTPVCKFMECPIQLIRQIKSPGDYPLTIKYTDGKLVIK
jgi:hypothetical protein